MYFWCQDRAEGQALSGGGRGGQRGRGGGVGPSLLSDLQLPRHLAEAAGQTKGEGRPVVPDGALGGGRERLGALPRTQETSPAPRPLAPPLAPGCGSARACRCAGSAGLRAGRARSSTRRSRPRCGRPGTGGRRCRTDLRGSGGQGGLPGPPTQAHLLRARLRLPGATLKPQRERSVGDVKVPGAGGGD